MVGQVSSDAPEPAKSTAHKSVLDGLQDNSEKFFKAFVYEAGLSPIQSLSQFVNESAGKHLPDLQISKPDSSLSSTVGGFCGDVAKYVILSKVVHSAFGSAQSKALTATVETLSVSIGKNALEATTVGAAAGFLTPVDNSHDYWKEKGISIGKSAASFGTMGGMASALGKTSFLSSESALSRTVAINGIAGLAGGTIDSVLDSSLHNQPITLDGTIKTAATYGLFGAAFGGVAHAAGANSYVGASEVEAAKIKTGTDNFEHVGESTVKPTLREHAESAFRTVQAKTLEFGNAIDNSIAKINPFLSGDGFPGMQLAYEGVGYGSTARVARPYFSDSPSLNTESRMLSVAHQAADARHGSRTVDFDQVRRPTTRETRTETARRVRAPHDESVVPTDAKARKPLDTRRQANNNSLEDTDVKSAKTYDLGSVLGSSERGRELLTALEQIKEESPSFLKGVRASSTRTLSGRDSLVIELADGKYKNAVLKFTTIFGDAKDTLTPSEWDAEWGRRPYDAPLLSSVHEVELGGRDIGYVYVQEKGDGATHVDSLYDPHDDASFARDKEDPDLAKIMAELESRQEEFVDPGSRQLAWSAIKGRLVLIDYAAVMRSADIPPEWRTPSAEGNNDASPDSPADKKGTVRSRETYDSTDYGEDTEEHDVPLSPVSEVRDATAEDLRYEFVRRPATSPAIDVQNQIAEQIFAGETDQDIRPYIEVVCQDSLKEIGKSAKDAIKWTRQILKDQKLI
jgi:hypothetical protein